MRRIYIGSTEPRAGKTVIASALARLAGDGAMYRAATPSGSTGAQDDAPLFPAEPKNDTRRRFIDNIESARSALTPRGRRRRQSPTIIIDGTGLDGGRLDAALAKELDADPVLIVWYDEHTMGEGDVSGIHAAMEPFGGSVEGIVINAAPELRMHFVETEILPAIARLGVPRVAALRQNRLLNAPTLREIVEHLEAEVVAYPEGLDVLAPRIMVGALALDGGVYYYGQAEDKVVVTRWDRPDLQMPALATGCQGLILTGGQGPIPYVQNRVDELRIPVAVVSGGTIAAAARLSDGFLGGRGSVHPDKVMAMARQLEDSRLAADLLAVTA